MENQSPPNAVSRDDDGEITKVGRLAGDNLKVRWAARHQEDGKWIEFNPADLEVELNGVPLITCTGVSIDFKRHEGFPSAKLSFTIESLDIDADTLVALEAFVAQQAVTG